MSDWVPNYFNYFTEIEEHFQKARGTSLFLLSPLDWALIESWKNAGVPLEAVLRGIDAAFEKWRARKKKTQMVNSLAYCAQAVLAEAQALAGSAPQTRERQSAPFAADELRGYLEDNAAALWKAGHEEMAAALDRLAAEAETHLANLEELEQRLTALEEKLISTIKAVQSEEELFQARRELDQQLRPYRGKMSADQIAMLERQYLERRLLDSVDVPRLSLFYLR
ncbi:MAG: hypothetical protein WD696_21370 [Bryobacteraceae bacterium]